MDDATLQAALAALNQENAARAAKLETLRGAGANAPLLDKKQLAALQKDYGRCVFLGFWVGGVWWLASGWPGGSIQCNRTPETNKPHTTGCGRCGRSGSAW